MFFKICNVCGENKSIEEFRFSSGSKDGYRNDCKKCQNKVAVKRYYLDVNQSRKQARERHAQNREANRLKLREYGKKMKELVINHYGGKCACCGETIIDFLTVDHINGGGTKERKENKGGGRYNYRFIVKNNFPNCYQILCFNCNCGRGLRNGDGICPHKKINNSL